ncbi:MAG: winged helix-turn-helix transcriptional regulator [Chloroflexi bacterium]|nr:winged helix-turn-helix transcriptional regulator [Chloroflexota bacterium]
MTHEQELLSALAKTTFRLNGQFLAVGEELAQPAGLTAALWQVLGAVLGSPRSVADVAREIGVTRQSVQRVADVLVDRGLAEYQPNPAHRRAKLLTPTAEGRQAIRRIGPAHAAFAQRLAEEFGTGALEVSLATVAHLSQALEQLGGPRRALRAAG